MKLWFTSDSHFGHYNIIKYAGRPFASVQEMDEAMVQGWNERVKPEDHVYHLGDVTMKRPKYSMGVLGRLNGHKRLVRGNHDIYKTKEYLEAGFEEIYGIRVIDNLLFTHIPVHPESLGRFKANVHGHIHEKVYPPITKYKYVNDQLDLTRPYIVPYINISVEQTNYHPVDIEWIRAKIEEVSKI